MSTIEAAVLEEFNQDFVLSEVELAEPQADEVEVDIRAVGICHTDLAVRAGDLPLPLPAVLGHEGAGVISAVGSGVTGLAVGDRVMLTPDACGHCPTCLAGRLPYCHDFMALNFGGVRADGSHTHHRGSQALSASFVGQSSFGTRALVPARCIVPLPDDVPFEVAAPLACGAQTGSGAVLNALHPEAGTGIVIFGAGPVGMSAAMAAKAAGCTRIVVVEPIAARREVAERLGATAVIDSAASADLVAEISAHRPDYAVDTTGQAEVIDVAISCLPPRGECALLGVPAPGVKLSTDLLHVTLGRFIRGVILGDEAPGLFLPRLFDLYRAGLFPVDQIITTYDFADINTAAADTVSGKAIKAVLLMP